MDNNEPINPNEILEKIQSITQLSFQVQNSKEKIKSNTIQIEQYKELIKFLMENQSYKETDLSALFPIGIFITCKRKEYIPFIQKEIYKLIQENKTETLILNQLKQSIIQYIKFSADVNYLNDGMKDELNNDIMKKLNGTNKGSESKGEDNDEDSD